MRFLWDSLDFGWVPCCHLIAKREREMSTYLSLQRITVRWGWTYERPDDKRLHNPGCNRLCLWPVQHIKTPGQVDRTRNANKTSGTICLLNLGYIGAVRLDLLWLAPSRLYGLALHQNYPAWMSLHQHYPAWLSQSERWSHLPYPLGSSWCSLSQTQRMAWRPRTTRVVGIEPA